MEQGPPPLPEVACRVTRSEALDPLPCPTGVFQVAEKMEKRTCALCPKGLDCSVLYFARSENIAAHENCLKCKLCHERGATVGCDEKACTKTYHFFCAKKDKAVLHNGSGGIYKVFCQQHAPKESPPVHSSRTKRGRKKGHSLNTLAQLREPITFSKSIKQMEEEDGRHTDAIVKAAFLKKCKDAGLLNDLFEEILDKLHLIQERLMDETTSESDYEEIGTSLFDCRLFEDTFVNFQTALENKIYQFEEKRQQMKEEIKLLQDLKQTLCSVQDNRNLRSSSTSVSSLSS